MVATNTCIIKRSRNERARKRRDVRDRVDYVKNHMSKKSPTQLKSYLRCVMRHTLYQLKEYTNMLKQCADDDLQTIDICDYNITVCQVQHRLLKQRLARIFR